MGAALQSRNGGWGAFDADNNALYLNNIPFSDHGALLDPPTEDVTGRCVSMLAQLGDARVGVCAPGLNSCVEPTRRWQLVRAWGLNYIYWHMVFAMRVENGVARRGPEMPRCDWLIAIENAGGGWGEDGSS